MYLQCRHIPLDYYVCKYKVDFIRPLSHLHKIICERFYTPMCHQVQNLSKFFHNILNLFQQMYFLCRKLKNKKKSLLPSEKDKKVSENPLWQCSTLILVTTTKCSSFSPSPLLLWLVSSFVPISNACMSVSCLPVFFYSYYLLAYFPEDASTTKTPQLRWSTMNVLKGRVGPFEPINSSLWLSIFSNLFPQRILFVQRYKICTYRLMELQREDYLTLLRKKEYLPNCHRTQFPFLVPQKKTFRLPTTVSILPWNILLWKVLLKRNKIFIIWSSFDSTQENIFISIFTHHHITHTPLADIFF